MSMRHVLVHDYYMIKESQVRYVIEDNLTSLRAMPSTHKDCYRRHAVGLSSRGVYKQNVRLPVL